MRFGFADDARQDQPSRAQMRPLVGVGGIFLDASAVGRLQHDIGKLCRATGFPPGEEFKWSPGRDLWMWENLRRDSREAFFKEVLGLLVEVEAEVVVVAVDADANSATPDARSPEDDATRLFLERASNRFLSDGGVLVVDRPSGGRDVENRFLADCALYLQDEGSYAIPERFALPVMTAQSRLVRLLQAADLVASCSLAYIAGENQYSPSIFDRIRPLLARNQGRAGGVGFKIHPDRRYLNLYHWLAHDEHFVKGNTGHPIPHGKLPYYLDDGLPQSS